MAKVGIIYWTGTGNTEEMAEIIESAAKSEGAEVDLHLVDSVDESIIAKYDVLALGCPAMGDEDLEDMQFEPFIDSIEPLISGKKIALFGSYGWGDGQWMNDWTDRMTTAGAVLVADSLTVNYEPGGDDVALCQEFGKTIANA